MLRLATKNDIQEIVTIAYDAIAFLKDNGVDQWQDGYPNEDTFLNDIQKEQLYVYEDNGRVIAMTVIQLAEELTYRTIEGQWLNDVAYATVHRCAISKYYRGKQIGKQLFLAIEQQVIQLGLSTIRIDTHEDNQVMQNLLNSLGYAYCGIITLDKEMTNPKRLAYQKII